MMRGRLIRKEKKGGETFEGRLQRIHATFKHLINLLRDRFLKGLCHIFLKMASARGEKGKKETSRKERKKQAVCRLLFFPSPDGSKGEVKCFLPSFASSGGRQGGRKQSERRRGAEQHSLIGGKGKKGGTVQNPSSV